MTLESDTVNLFQNTDSQIMLKEQWQRHHHLENTLKERPKTLLTFEIFGQSGEEPWPDQPVKKRQDKDKDNDV